VSHFVTVGVLLGALFGVMHAAHIYRQRLADGNGNTARAIYFALWTVGLWILFSAYLLAFWLIGAVGLLAARCRHGTVAKP